MCLSVTGLVQSCNVLKVHPYGSVCQNFLFKAESYSILHTYHASFIHSSFNGQSDFNTSALSENVRISVWDPASSYFGYIPNSGVVGPYGISTFNFSRSHHTVSLSGCTVLHSCQQCTGFWFLCTSRSTCYFFFWVWGENSLWFWFAILLTISGFESLFIYLLAICVALLVEL